MPFLVENRIFRGVEPVDRLAGGCGMENAEIRTATGMERSNGRERAVMTARWHSRF